MYILEIALIKTDLIVVLFLLILIIVYLLTEVSIKTEVY